MVNKKSQNIAGPVWKLGALNNAGLRPLAKAFAQQRQKTKKKLPRYVQTRKLKSGKIAYYWCPPHWARKNNFPLISEALGFHLDKAQERIEVLNSYLDNWREGQKT